MAGRKKDIDKDTITTPFIELPLQALKVRRNLLTFSIASLAVVKYGEIHGKFKFLNIEGPELSACTINWLLLVITTYFLVYFFFLGYQTQHKWKLRMTGLCLEDFTVETIHLENSLQTDESLKQNTAMEDIVKRTNEIIKKLDGLQKIPMGNQDVQGLKEATNNLKDAFNSYNVDKEKLKHVTHSFFKYQNNYKANWILEYALPVSLGVAAVISMVIHIFIGPIYWPWMANLSPC